MCSLQRISENSFFDLYQFQETLWWLAEKDCSAYLRLLWASLPSCSFVEKLHKLSCDASQERKRALLSGTQFHLKGGKRCAIKPKPRRKQGVIKTRPEVNEIEKKEENGRKLIKPEVNEIDEPLTRLIRKTVITNEQYQGWKRERHPGSCWNQEDS